MSREAAGDRATRVAEVAPLLSAGGTRFDTDQSEHSQLRLARGETDCQHWDDGEQGTSCCPAAVAVLRIVLRIALRIVQVAVRNAVLDTAEYGHGTAVAVAVAVADETHDTSSVVMHVDGSAKATVCFARGSHALKYEVGAAAAPAASHQTGAQVQNTEAGRQRHSIQDSRLDTAATRETPTVLQSRSFQCDSMQGDSLRDRPSR